MSKLLFDTAPLVIDPDLAKSIGLNEAIILQQLHYWTEINKRGNRNYKEGYTWVYNTLEEWQQQFPFWSTDTIKRTMTKLKTIGLIVTATLNKAKMDRTTWYRIDYEKLETLHKPSISHDEGKMHSSKNAKYTQAIGQNAPSNTRDYKEINTDTHTNFNISKSKDPRRTDSYYKESRPTAAPYIPYELPTVPEPTPQAAEIIAKELDKIRQIKERNSKS